MKKNIIANIFGKIWGVFSNFLFVPLYIKLLGFTSYSIISYTLVIAGVLAIIDSGLTATLSREFSRQDKDNLQKAKTYETLQIIYITLALCGVALIWIFSNQIANQLSIKNFSNGDLAYLFKIASIDLSFQLLFRFFLGGLIGLNKQVKANAVLIMWGICRNALVLVIIFFWPSLEWFFTWQAVSTIVFTVLAKLLLDKETYKNQNFNLRIKFNKQAFNNVKRFTYGMLLIAVISAISSQTDKVMISKLMNLETLGYYTLAVSLSSILMIVVSPIATAVLPQITQLYSVNNMVSIKDIFNRYNKLISIIVSSILFVLIFFSGPLIEIWTGNKELANRSKMFVPYIALANAFVVLQTMYYQIALAAAYTKLNNIIGIINAIIIIPLYFFSFSLFGVSGIPAAYLFLQIANFFFYIYFINKEFLREVFLKELVFKQLLAPMIIAVVVSYFFSLLTPLLSYNKILLLMSACFSFVLSLVINFIFILPVEERAVIINSSKKNIFRK